MLLVSLVAAVALLLGVVAAVLVFSGNLFTNEPKTDAERDYQLLVEGLEKDPKNPTILISLAEAEYELGKEQEAFEHAKASITFAKKMPGYRMRYATLLVRSEKLKDARAQVEAEIALKTKGDAEPFFLIAQIDREEKKYDDAIQSMESALKIAPTAADMRVVYGDILAEAGKKKDAVNQYKFALRFLPGDPRAVAGLKKLGVEPPKSADTTSPHDAPVQ